jgi:hypothetical protein
MLMINSSWLSHLCFDSILLWVATFHKLSTGLDECTAPDSTSQLGWVVHETRLSFSSNTVIKAMCLSQAPVGGRLLGLWGIYHRYAIGTFNTCSRVPTHQFLTDTGGSYHIENLGIATALSPPFPSEGSTDPPNSPARSPFLSNNNIQG